MRRFRNIILSVIGIGASVLLIGFVLFANHATTLPSGEDVRAEGIVVLTGGAQRIRHAASLLKQKRANRLLISGVNRVTTKLDLRRIAKMDDDLFNCCVDIGYLAQNTRGNAMETRKWVSQHGFDSLIVVTASFHMPRSLSELASVLPDVKLVPYPVLTPRFKNSQWWLDWRATATLALEYLKFLPSAAHCSIARLRRGADNGAPKPASMRAGNSQ